MWYLGRLGALDPLELELKTFVFYISAGNQTHILYKDVQAT